MALTMRKAMIDGQYGTVCILVCNVQKECRLLRSRYAVSEARQTRAGYHDELTTTRQKMGQKRVLIVSLPVQYANNIRALESSNARLCQQYDADGSF